MMKQLDETVRSLQRNGVGHCCVLSFCHLRAVVISFSGETELFLPCQLS